MDNLDATPIAQPLRGILIFLVIFGCAAIPLALALWRMQRRNRPRQLRIPFADRDALIYQVTKILSQVGFSQGATAGQTVLFEPNGPQKLFGMAPIELLFDQPAAARLTATNGIMRRIAHIFRGATEEKYTGPTKFPFKGFAIAFGLLLGFMVIIVGGVAMVHRNTGEGSNLPSQDLNVEQVLNVTAAQARSGAIVNFTIAHTGMAFSVHIPRNSPDGTKLRF